MISTIQSPGLKIPEDLEQRIYTDLEKIEKIYPRIESCKVLMKEIKVEQKVNYQMEVTLQLPGGKIFLSERRESFEIGLKQIINKLKRLVVRYRDNQRKQKKNQRGITRRKSSELLDQ
jgi:putative sigma-54 modulation protein